MQFEHFTDRLGARHLSTSDVFRAASKRLDCDQSPATGVGFHASWRTWPDSTVWDMVRERSHCLLHCGGFILDGFPRTIVQAHSSKGLLEKKSLSLTAVADFELRTAEIVERLSGRRTCDGCKAVFHIPERPSKDKSICDRCGGHPLLRAVIIKEKRISLHRSKRG